MLPIRNIVLLLFIFIEEIVLYSICSTLFFCDKVSSTDIQYSVMSFNYDDLPPEIEYEENECSIMVYPPHTEEVKYVDNPYFTNEESLLDAINDYCNLKIEFYDEDDEEFDSNKKEL